MQFGRDRAVDGDYCIDHRMLVNAGAAPRHGPPLAARSRKNAGILTSLDGGGLRSNTHDLLAFIDFAVVAERLCEQMALAPSEMLAYLKTRGCRVGGVTLGERGLLGTTRPARSARSARFQ
jgi:hypothetical protein